MSENTGKKSVEEVMALYAKHEEERAKVNGENSVRNESPADRVGKKISQEALRQAVAENQAGPSIEEARQIRRDEINEDIHNQHLGYINLPVEDLPSGGIFYPQGTKISIRAASGGDIRHWSMVNERDLSAIDDALNYMIERCATISFPTDSGMSSWKDLKEIDRFYVIMAIRDFTFTEGHNELKVIISETEDIVVKKDNIKFIDLPDGLLKYYNEKDRCFTIPTINDRLKSINFYLPAVGTTQWLKNYIQRKQQAQEQFDEDFVTIAPMLIKDYRNLNDRKYIELVQYSSNFSIYDWSLIQKVKKSIEDAISPKVVYVDKGGIEQEAPLNFRGGIKALFLYDVADSLGF